jgi:hypothetical protein
VRKSVSFNSIADAVVHVPSCSDMTLLERESNWYDDVETR